MLKLLYTNTISTSCVFRKKQHTCVMLSLEQEDFYNCKLKRISPDLQKLNGVSVFEKLEAFLLPLLVPILWDLRAPGYTVCPLYPVMWLTTPAISTSMLFCTAGLNMCFPFAKITSCLRKSFLQQHQQIFSAKVLQVRKEDKWNLVQLFKMHMLATKSSFRGSTLANAMYVLCPDCLSSH